MMLYFRFLVTGFLTFPFFSGVCSRPPSISIADGPSDVRTATRSAALCGEYFAPWLLYLMFNCNLHLRAACLLMSPEPGLMHYAIRAVTMQYDTVGFYLVSRLAALSALIRCSNKMERKHYQKDTNNRFRGNWNLRCASVASQWHNCL